MNYIYISIYLQIIFTQTLWQTLVSSNMFQPQLAWSEPTYPSGGGSAIKNLWIRERLGVLQPGSSSIFFNTCWKKHVFTTLLLTSSEISTLNPIHSRILAGSRWSCEWFPGSSGEVLRGKLQGWRPHGGRGSWPKWGTFWEISESYGKFMGNIFGKLSVGYFLELWENDEQQLWAGYPEVQFNFLEVAIIMILINTYI